MNPLFWVVSWTSLFREIFSTTSLFLLNNISKQLADKLSSISEAPKRGAGLNLFPYLWTARDLGGGWDCRDHPDGTQRAPCRWTLGVHLETQGAFHAAQQTQQVGRCLLWNGSGLKCISSTHLVSHSHAKMWHSQHLWVPLGCWRHRPHTDSVFINCPRVRSAVQGCEAAFPAMLAWSKCRARCWRNKVIYKHL